MLRRIVSAIGDLFRSRVFLDAENCALRQQVAVLKQRPGRRRVRLSWRDRLLWVDLSKLRLARRTAPAIVRPETLLGRQSC